MFTRPGKTFCAPTTFFLGCPNLSIDGSISANESPAKKPVVGRQDTHAPNIGGYQTTDLYLFLVTQNEMVKAIAWFRGNSPFQETLKCMCIYIYVKHVYVYI